VPSLKLVTCWVVGVPAGLAISETFTAPSIVKLQSNEGSMPLFAVQLKVTEVIFVTWLSSGLFNTIDGCTVSTVKLLVSLEFTFPESSTQVMFQ